LLVNIPLTNSDHNNMQQQNKVAIVTEIPK